MKPVSFVAIEGLKIDDDLGNGDRFFDSLRISNNTAPIRKYLDDRGIRETIGILEINSIKESKAYIYKHFEARNGKEVIAENLRFRELRKEYPDYSLLSFS